MLDVPPYRSLLTSSASAPGDLCPSPVSPDYGGFVVPVDIETKLSTKRDTCETSTVHTVPTLMVSKSSVSSDTSVTSDASLPNSTDPSESVIGNDAVPVTPVDDVLTDLTSRPDPPSTLPGVEPRLSLASQASSRMSISSALSNIASVSDATWSDASPSPPDTPTTSDLNGSTSVFSLPPAYRTDVSATPDPPESDIYPNTLLSPIPGSDASPGPDTPISDLNSSINSNISVFSLPPTPRTDISATPDPPESNLFPNTLLSPIPGSDASPSPDTPEPDMTSQTDRKVKFHLPSTASDISDTPESDFPLPKRDTKVSFYLSPQSSPDALPSPASDFSGTSAEPESNNKIFGLSPIPASDASSGPDTPELDDGGKKDSK